MKIIKIENCKECPIRNYCKYYNCDMIWRDDKDNLNKIHPGCILEDYYENKEENNRD